VSENAVEASGLTRLFGDRKALDAVDFNVQEGEIFALLGPNGGGKSTFFRILSTLLSPSSGKASVFGLDVAEQPSEVRRKLGVVFQSPSLDKQLTVRENMRCQGALYGMGGAAVNDAIKGQLERFGLQGREDDPVRTLSGGLARRVEVAKSLMHTPALLLLDEPSTGLDPGARRDLWAQLEDVRAKDGVTVLLTTHIMDEADGCDRVGILNEGKMIALGTPGDMKSEIFGDVITMTCSDPEELVKSIRSIFDRDAKVIREGVRMEIDQGHDFIPQLRRELGTLIDSVTLGKPTLEDVFLVKTGHSFKIDSE